LKPEADSTGLFNRGLPAFALDGLRRGERGYLGCSLGKAFPIRAIRVIRGSILPLVAVICFSSFSNSAKAQALTNANAPAIDGIDCITAYDAEEDSTQVCDNSPNPWNDLDEISLPLNDKAVIPSRSGQETPRTTTTTVAPITLRQPGFVPAFLFSTYSSDALREQIRERAPPCRAVAFGVGGPILA
jgi:hypothetical protein